MTTKYLKFGLRADKNLEDLTNPNSALSNVLDNISGALDENNAPTGFTVEDIRPTVGLRNTGLADNTNGAGQSTDLLNLTGSLVEFTVGVGTTLSGVSPGTILEVQPRRTLQDHISNFKSVMGNPPWIDGGDGPIARFVPSDRINATITVNTTGNSSAVAIGSLSNNLFSTSLVNDYVDMIYPVDFWNDGVFDFTAKLHPSLPNTYGLIQWIGYLSGDYSQTWESTGLFMIEEDVVDAGNENNWTQIKSVFNFSQTITGLVLSNDGTNTTVNLTNGSPSGEKYVSSGMIARTSGQTYAQAKQAGQIVESVDMENKTCLIPGVITGTALTFDHVGGVDMVETPIVFTPQKRGNRLRVRYTVWYPDPGNGANYQNKRFAESSDNSDKLPFTRLYSTYDRSQVFGPYTYKYFEDNKASPLNQLSTNPIRVNSTLSMPYSVPLLHTDKLVGASGSAVTMKTVTIEDLYGKLSATNWTGCSVGDWLTFKNSSTYYTYQIQEISGENIYVKDTIESDTGIAVGGTFSAMIWKNVGLIGVYKLSSSGGQTGSLYKMSGEGALPAKVYPDQILFGVADNGTSNSTTKRHITSSVIAGSQNNIIVNSSGPTANSINFNGVLPNVAAGSICAVYASRGLDDKSSVLSCAGVYGKEVASTTSSGNSVTLISTSGISALDYVQFDGRLKDSSGNLIGNPIIPYGTQVQTVVNATTIVLTNSVNSALNAASTLVFCKNDPGNDVATRNKEFCIIPLNTAPPFAGTSLGLATPSSNANLEVEGLSFADLAVTVPTNHIVALSGTIANPTKYFPLQTSGGTTYKVLIA